MLLLKQAIEWAAGDDSTGVAGPRVPSPRTTLSEAVPCPFRFDVTIHYSLANAGRASLAVYDPAGKRVGTLVSGYQPAGAGQVKWNRTDDAGRTVARGVYFCWLHADGTSLSRKLAVR